MKSLAIYCLVLVSCIAAEPTIDEVIASAATEDMTKSLYMNDDSVMVEMDMLYKVEDYEEIIREKAKEQESGRVKRGGPIRNTRKRWTNKVVPYSIASGIFSSSDRRQIQNGINEWEKYTCLSFKQRGGERNYVEISQGAGCSSYVGMIGGRQRLSLDRGCRSLATIVHEIGHAIGFEHEQCRPDRDSYLTINTGNIISRYLFAFEKYSTSHIDTQGVPYDYTSVMHYGPRGFSRNGRDTMTTKDSRYQSVIGRAPTLSFRDVKAANLMYNCNSHCASKSCPGEGFVGKDCVCYCPGTASQPLKKCDGSGPGPTNPPPTAGPPPSCSDNHSRCAEWAARGECSNNPRYMLVQCKKSCDVCSGGANCKNDHSSCDYWASRGECDANPNWMRVNCRKACQEC